MSNWRYGLSYILMKEGLKADGCPICTLLVSGMRRNLFWFLYENVNNLHIRKQLYESDGYCITHAWLLYQIEREEWNDNLDVAIIHRDLVKKSVEALQKNIPNIKGKSSFNFLKKWFKYFRDKKAQKQITEKTTCPACLHQQKLENVYIGSLIESLTIPEFRDLYKESFGLCINHYRKTMEKLQDENIRNFLFDVQRSKMNKIMELLDEYIRKHDYRFVNEPKGEEMNSPRWAVEMLVGKNR